MTVMLLLVATVAAGACAAAGYLFAARLGRDARRALQAGLAESVSREESLRAAVADRDTRLRSAHTIEEVTALKEELAASLREIRHREESFQESLKRQLAGVAGALASRDGERALREEVRRHLQPLMDRRREDQKVAERMERLLIPMIERERVGHELARVGAGPGAGRGLPALLDAIAERGGFSSVILSDEVGLPLANSAGAADIETHAGIASLLLTLRDRVASNGRPPPLAVLMHDEASGLTVHRIFRTGGDRFVLTAVAKGGQVPPNVLDPALGSIERALVSRSN